MASKASIKITANESSKRVDMLVEGTEFGFGRTFTAKEARDLAEALNQAADDVAPPRKAKGK